MSLSTEASSGKFTIQAALRSLIFPLSFEERLIQKNMCGSVEGWKKFADT